MKTQILKTQKSLLLLDPNNDSKTLNIPRSNFPKNVDDIVKDILVNVSIPIYEVVIPQVDLIRRYCICEQQKRQDETEKKKLD